MVNHHTRFSCIYSRPSYPRNSSEGPTQEKSSTTQAPTTRARISTKRSSQATAHDHFVPPSPYACHRAHCPFVLHLQCVHIQCSLRVLRGIPVCIYGKIWVYYLAVRLDFPRHWCRSPLGRGRSCGSRPFSLSKDRTQSRCTFHGKRPGAEAVHWYDW